MHLSPTGSQNELLRLPTYRKGGGGAEPCCSLGTAVKSICGLERGQAQGGLSIPSAFPEKSMVFRAGTFLPTCAK